MRGFIRLRTIVFLAAIAAVVVVVLAYGRMGLTYYRVKQEAIQLANSDLVQLESSSTAFDRFLLDVHQRTGITLTRSDVAVKHDRARGVVSVDVSVTLPITYILLNRTEYKPYVIHIEAKRIKDY
jgi:hypothetical protein